MGILDDIRAEAAKHPEWDEVHARTVQRMAEIDFNETAAGEVYRHLQAIGERDGVEVSVEEKVWGRTVFQYGEDSATLFTQIDASGIAKLCTPTLDLRKPWWREAFLEKTQEGKMEHIGLVAPSLLEILELHSSPSAAENLSHQALTYSESDVYGDAQHQEQDVGRRVTETMRDFLQPLVSPHFEVQFDNGNGDLWRKLRLKPKTKQGSQALLQGGAVLDDVLRKIVERKQELETALKTQLQPR